MNKKQLQQLFKALAPADGQKERLYERIKADSQTKANGAVLLDSRTKADGQVLPDSRAKADGLVLADRRTKADDPVLADARNEQFTSSHAPMNRILKSGKRRVHVGALAAVLLVCLATTAVAASYIGLDEAFFRFLKPVNEEQAQQLSSGAYHVDKQVALKQGTVNIKQVIGDSNLAYIVMDFTAPAGTVLDAARYRFEYGTLLGTKEQFLSTGYQVLDDPDSHDNTITLVMSIMTHNSLQGEKVTLSLDDMQAAGPFPGEFRTIFPGTWEADLQLDFRNVAAEYEVNKHVSLYGHQAKLKTVAVSPISIALKLEAADLKSIYDAAGERKEVGPNEYLDQFPVTILYKDGTTETTRIFDGIQLGSLGSGQQLLVKRFAQVINDKEIASLRFFGLEIPVGEGGKMIQVR